jgi:hypothetical protein
VAVTFVGAGAILEKGAGATTAAVPFPASINANDIAVLAWGQNTATVTGPFTGWTTARTQSSTGDTLVPALYLGYQLMAGTESSTSPNITVLSAAGSGAIMVFRGVDTTTPLDTTVSYIDKTATTSSVAIPTLTTTVTDTALVYAAIQNSATGPSTPPSSPAAFTEDADRVAGRNFCAGHLIWSGSGATGTVTTVLAATTRGLGLMLALRPAATSTGLPDLVMAPRIGV